LFISPLMTLYNLSSWQHDQIPD